ncbi:MAG: Mut7-C RNAse domain-containing protein [Anaerolineae bacterium]|nr:Mut7-C RNAse domain-containing protein [Anaerolineae bacterium]
MTETSQEMPRLLADSMLGRLARWLRFLGYDTLYISMLSDHQIAARARAEGRIVLTRDQELSRRRGIRCLYVHADTLEEQVREVLAAIGDPPPGVESRCSECNSVLTSVAPEQARPHVPAYVLAAHRQFHHCPECDKYFWAGSHWTRIRSTVERVMEHRDGGAARTVPMDGPSGPKPSGKGGSLP